MSKYSSEFKLEVVNYYLSNYTSYNDVAKYFDISSLLVIIFINK